MHIVKKGIIRQMIASTTNEMALQVNVNVDGSLLPWKLRCGRRCLSASMSVSRSSSSLMYM